MKKYRAIKFYFTIAFFAIFLLLPKLSLATSDLVINEIMYNLPKPGADENHEWIELYNAGSSEIDLTDFKFNDGSNHILNPPPQNASRGSLIIPPGGYLILSGNASTTISDLSNYNGSIIDTVMSLNNTSATLKILNKDGLEIASASYTKEMGAGGDGKTLSWDGTSFKESAADGGTPGEKNIIAPGPNIADSPNLPDQPIPPVQEEQVQNQSPVPESAATSTAQTSVLLKNYSDKIFINEFMPAPNPSPEGSKEWVELFSQDSQTIDLSNWQIDDEPEKSAPQIIPNGTLIEPQKFLVIKLNTNILNNNEGDQVRLLWPDSQTVHSVSYQNAKQGFSSSRFEAGLWLWTENPTPGQENKKPASKVQAPAEQGHQASQQGETLAETQKQIQQTPLPPTTQTATTKIPPPEQPKTNPLIETAQENVAPKKSSQSTNKTTSQKNKTPNFPNSPDSPNIPNSPNLQAAIATPLQKQIAPKNSNSNILLSLAAVLILSLTASIGLIYFKRKKSVDGKK